MRVAKRQHLDALEAHNLLELAEVCTEALERAYAAVALLDARGCGAPQHIACRLGSALAFDLEAADRIAEMYGRPCPHDCTEPCGCAASEASGFPRAPATWRNA